MKLVEKNPNGFGIVGIVAVVAVLLVFIGGGYFAYQRFTEKKAALSQVDSFKDCVRAGYSVAESYPRQCYTPDGKRFAETVEGEATDTSTWKTYRNEKYGFEVRYPQSLEPLEGKTLFPKLFYRGIPRIISGPLLDVCFASVVRQEFYCDFELFVWDTGVDAYISSPGKFFGMNRCAQEKTYLPRFGTIAGVEIDVCERSDAGELYIRNAIARNNNLVFILSTEPRAGYLAASGKDALFHAILSTFKFIK